jgi:hypothetical protein
MGKKRQRAIILVTYGLVATVVVVVVLWLTNSPPRKPIDSPEGGLPAHIEGGSEPIQGKFIGHSQSSILGRFGPPDHQWKGHYGDPPLEYRRKYPDAVTLIYKR